VLASNFKEDVTMKKLLGLVICLAAGATHAQTYDINVDMKGVGDFSGSFTYNSGVYSNVDVSDTFTHGIFTGINADGESGKTLDFYDFEGKPNAKAAGSNVFILGLSTMRPLGIRNPGVNINSVFYNLDSNSTGIFSCGSNAAPGSGLRCTASLREVPSPTHQAPELDWSLAAAAFTLLCGFTLALRSRRSA
jgi:hypothetical protein